MTAIVANFIYVLSVVLTVAIIIRALMSWIMPNDTGSITRVLYDVTEPVLAPIRRVLPPVGGLDLSPILALIAIQVVSQVLIQLLASAG